VDGKKNLPAIAGVKGPFHVAVARDKTDPQLCSYRAYMEMMNSGNLIAVQVRMITDYRASYHDMILGVPTGLRLQHRRSGRLSFPMATLTG